MIGSFSLAVLVVNVLCGAAVFFALHYTYRLLKAPQVKNEISQGLRGNYWIKLTQEGGATFICSVPGFETERDAQAALRRFKAGF